MANKYPERKIDITKVVSVLAITVLLFVAGILFGQFLTNQKYADIKTIDQNLVLELQDLEVQTALASNYPCSNFALYALGDRIDELGSKITSLENQIGKNNPKVIELKRPYTLLLIKHYLLIKDRISKCNENYVTILFFYSNKPENVDASERQGYIFGFLANKYSYDKVKVYSIDGDLDLGTIKALKNLYNVTVYPTTVINDQVLVGFHSKEEFEKYFN